jgi:hypothetical protein
MTNPTINKLEKIIAIQRRLMSVLASMNLLSAGLSQYKKTENLINGDQRTNNGKFITNCDNFISSSMLEIIELQKQLDKFAKNMEL